MTPVVIDASAGVEILANTAHGRRLAQLLPTDAVYVALAAELGGALLTDDHRLVNAPGFPTNVSALTLDRT